MYCDRCGNEVDINDQFCPNCGNNLKPKFNSDKGDNYEDEASKKVKTFALIVFIVSLVIFIANSLNILFDKSVVILRYAYTGSVYVLLFSSVVSKYITYSSLSIGRKPLIDSKYVTYSGVSFWYELFKLFLKPAIADSDNKLVINRIEPITTFLTTLAFLL